MGHITFYSFTSWRVARKRAKGCNWSPGLSLATPGIDQIAKQQLTLTKGGTGKQSWNNVPCAPSVSVTYCWSICGLHCIKFTRSHADRQLWAMSDNRTIDLNQISLSTTEKCSYMHAVFRAPTNMTLLCLPPPRWTAAMRKGSVGNSLL